MFYQRIWIITLFLMLVGGSGPVAATPQEQQAQNHTAEWQAALSDVGRLHLAEITQDVQGTWVIIHVTASPLSGHPLLSGSRVDARTGKFLPGSPTADMQGIKAVELVNGVYSVSEGLTSAARPLATGSEQEYHWESNAFKENIKDLTIDSDTAFVGPHNRTITAICRLNLDKTGAEAFSSTCVIPNEWEPFVTPAVQFYRQHPNMFAESGTAKDNLALASLLHSDNPFLAAAACRALAQAGYFSPASAFSLVERSQGVQQALFAYLLLHFCPPASEGSIAAILGNVAETAATSEQLHPVALAAYVRHQETWLQGGDQSLPPLFERIDRKAFLLDPDPQTSGDASAKSIDDILKNAQVRKNALSLR